jgi:hypothetical protein
MEMLLMLGLQRIKIRALRVNLFVNINHICIMCLWEKITINIMVNSRVSILHPTLLPCIHFFFWGGSCSIGVEM